MDRRKFIISASGFPLISYIKNSHAHILESSKFLYGYPAGGTGDAIARRIAEAIKNSEFTRQSPIVENKVGAGGRIALETLKSSKPDGSVLCLSQSSAFTIFPHIYNNLSYRNDDFEPVAVAAVMQHGLAIGPMVPDNVRNLKDFLKWAKDNPINSSFGTPGNGGLPHFLGILLANSTSVDLKHVPYKGVMPSIQDMVGGQIAATIGPCGDFLSYAAAGKIRVLATSGTERNPSLKEVPTFIEQGFEEVHGEEWFGFYAKSGTASRTINAAVQAINNSLDDVKVIETIKNLALIKKVLRPEEMLKIQKREFLRWGEVIRKIGFTTDS